MKKIPYDIILVSLVVGGLVSLSLFCNVKKENFVVRESMSIYPAGLISNGVPGQVQGEVDNQMTDCMNWFSPLSNNKVGRKPPLAEDELNIFAENKVSPECCGSGSYSSSNGCICETPEQMQYLNNRGGNRYNHDYY
tara:strand:- start:343 stop:753 length:411 start_codon:yes stop_codon:yes gene_type:complete